MPPACHKALVATFGLRVSQFWLSIFTVMSKSISEWLEYVVDSLNESDVETVEKATKISKWTLLKIRQRQIKNPGVLSVEPLYNYFKRLERRA